MRNTITARRYICLSLQQVQYGVLLAIVQAQESLGSMCVVQKLETLEAIDGSALLTEFDCPILNLTSELFHVSPFNIFKPVSIIHICSSTCRMINATNFVHDFSNGMFCLNIYCTGNY